MGDKCCGGCPRAPPACPADTACPAAQGAAGGIAPCSDHSDGPCCTAPPNDVSERRALMLITCARSQKTRRRGAHLHAQPVPGWARCRRSWVIGWGRVAQGTAYATGFLFNPQNPPLCTLGYLGSCGVATSTSWVTPVVVKGDDVPLHGERDLRTRDLAPKPASPGTKQPLGWGHTARRSRPSILPVRRWSDRSCCRPGWRGAAHT